MSDTQALRRLLIYAREEALTHHEKSVAQLLAHAIAELSPDRASGAQEPGLCDGTFPSDRASGYLQ